MACGIYAIEHLESGRQYIGSSVNTRKRWYQHRLQLGRGDHHSPHLQNAWNKYGAAAFELKILQECPREELFEREQFCLDTLQPEFNCSPTANSPRGVKRSPETVEKMRQTRKGICPPKEQMEALWEGNRGKTRPEHVVEATRRANSKTYVVTDPTGVVQVIQNLTAFCRAQGLCDRNMGQVSVGKAQQYKGWHVRPLLPGEDPNHLQATQVTPPRRQRKRQTHCKAGHPLEGPNVYVYQGERTCKVCKAERQRRHRAAEKG
jgi:group I intron endonuclease